MLTSGRTGPFAGQRGSCRRAQGDLRRFRHLSVEPLEQRWLLSADFFGWQNVLTPADVNADGTISAVDAFLVVYELYTGGARQLDPPSVSSGATLTTEGEQASRAYVDVNGDNNLSAVDALLVLTQLRAEGQTDLVEFRLETTDLSGTPITSVEQGGSFLLNVYVQDLRADTVSNRGVSLAYLDVTFDDALVTAVGPVSHGAAYQEDAAGSLATPGLVDELGGTQTGYGLTPPYVGPLGAGEFLLASIPFEATTPGTVAFSSNPADLAIYHDVTFYEPLETIPADDIVYGSTTLTVFTDPLVAQLDTFAVNEATSNNTLDVLANDEINSGGTLSIVAVGSTNHGGTVVIQGDHLLYTPASDFFGTETFTYTISDGLGNTDEGTVVVTVADRDVGFRLEATDLSGTPITSVEQGDSFILNVYVQDLRADTVSNRGVSLAYLDVTFDDALVTAVGPVSHGAAYQEDAAGSLATPGLVDELGGTQTGYGLDPPYVGPLGAGEFLLASISFEATALGTVVFGSNPADLAIYHDVTFYEPLETVPAADVAFGSTTLTVVAGPLVAKLDTFAVNEDTSNNTLDVLANDEINSGGTLSIVEVGGTNHGGTVVIDGDHLLYTPAQDFFGTETFTYTISDGLGNTDEGTVVVTVANSNNDPPVANGDSYGTQSDQVLITGNVLANDTDPDADPLSVLSINTTGTKGVVTNNGDGTFQYDPNGQFNQLADGQQATDTFTYTVTDGQGGSDEATVTITVTGAPDPLVAQPDTFDVNEDTSNNALDVLANDEMNSGGALSIVEVGGTDHGGTVVIQGDHLLYTPAHNFYGDETFTYTITDGLGNTAEATVVVTVANSNNDAPVANDDGGTGYTTRNDQVLTTANVLANDTDPDADSLSVISINTTGTKGLVTNNGDGTFQYNPNGQFDQLADGDQAPDTFTYTVTDGHGLTDTATVTITVTGAPLVPDPLVAELDTFTVNEATSNNTLDVLANDEINSGGTLSIVEVGGTNHGGTVVIQGDRLLYTPTHSFIGEETFTYTISDGLGNTDVGTVVVTVADRDVGFRLEATDLSGTPITSVGQGDFFLLNVYVQDLRASTVSNRGVSQAYLDVTFDDALVTAVGPVSHGAAYQEDAAGSLATPGLVNELGGVQTGYGLDPFGPLGAGEFLLASVVFEATTPGTVAFSSDPADLAIYHDVAFYEPLETVPAADVAFGSTTLTVVASPLVARFDTFAVNEDTSNNTLDVLANDEVDSGGTLSIVEVGGTNHGGTVVVQGDHLLYTPAQNFFGTETFTYTISDGLGNTDEGTVVVTVANSNNDPPVANDDSYGTKSDQVLITGNVLANDTDPDADPLSVLSINTTGTKGVVTNNGDGTFTYDPNGQFDSLHDGESATDTFVYTVGDGQGGSDTATVTITVTGVPDPLVAQSDTFDVNEDTSNNALDVLANDEVASGGTLSIVAVGGTDHGGTVVIQGDHLLYTPAHNFFGTETFAYTIGDGLGNTDEGTVLVTVANSNNDPPVANDDGGTGYTTREDQGLTTANVLANDTDPDADPLSVISINTTGTKGLVTNNGNGTFQYNPNGQFDQLADGQQATDTFTYTVTDGRGLTDTATVTITVTGVPDPLVAQLDTFTVNEATSGNTLDVLANDEANTGGTLSIVAVGGTNHGGTVVIQGDRLLYTPAQYFIGEETFTYTISDGLGNTDVGTVIVTVADRDVGFRLEATDLSGTPITSVEQGDSFILNVYVQDLRASTVSNRGVSQAYLDVTFDDALVTAVGPVSHGAAYQEDTAGSLATPGLVNELGGVQTGYGLDPFGPLGAGEFLLASITFEATTPGTVAFSSDPADLAIYHDVAFYEPPDTVPAADVVYGSTTLTVVAGPLVAQLDTFAVNEDTSNNTLDVLANDEVNSGGTLSIVGVGGTNHGGTVVVQGDHLLYTPAHNFIGTETFTYTISDGLGNTDQGTVVVTVANSNNDAPVTNDDGNTGYTTRNDRVLITANVLANDTDPDADALSVISINTTGTKGVVTNNGDGTFRYNPNGQFNQLAYGQQATDTFTYTVTDGHGLTDTATVTITVTAAPPVAGDVTGVVFADVDNDCVQDAGERAIGGVEVRLQGVDFSGAAVSRTTRTDAQGQYRFANVNPGNYQLTEVQPRFFVDGIDTIGGVVNTGPNDCIVITSDMSLSGSTIAFGERSLEPAFLGIANCLNSSLHDGIVAALDNQGNMLWYSLMDGWDDVASVSVTCSADGLTATLTATSELEGDLVFSVPTAPVQMQYRVLGRTSEGCVVQFVGTMAEFQQRAADQTAQEPEDETPGPTWPDAWFSLLGR